MLVDFDVRGQQGMDLFIEESIIMYHVLVFLLEVTIWS